MYVNINTKKYDIASPKFPVELGFYDGKLSDNILKSLYKFKLLNNSFAELIQNNLKYKRRITRIQHIIYDCKESVCKTGQVEFVTLRLYPNKIMVI